MLDGKPKPGARARGAGAEAPARGAGRSRKASPATPSRQPGIDAAPSPAADPAGRTPGTRDPGRTSAAILAAAIAEFSEKGLGGARIDAIAERAGINKRMLYHYFGDKEALYARALKEIYAGIRSAERELRLESLDPVAGIRQLGQRMRIVISPDDLPVGDLGGRTIGLRRENDGPEIEAGGGHRQHAAELTAPDNADRLH